MAATPSPVLASRASLPVISASQLPGPYRQALILTEYQGLTQKQLAERMGLSLSGAKSRVQRARKMLKELLLECCHFEFDRYGTVFDYRPRNCKRCCGDGESSKC